MIRATWVQTGEDFDIGPDVDERSRELIARLHLRTSKSMRPDRELVECRGHDRPEDDDDPSLASLRGSDGRVHGIYVALVKRNQGTSQETWTVSHVDGRASHTIRVGKGWRHQREQDEWCAAASAAGWPVDQEVRIASGNVCDVLIEGAEGRRFDIEVQRYGMTIPAAKGRVTKIRNGHVEPVFSADHITKWNENNAIPNVRTNDLMDALSAVRPARDEWKVVGGVRSVYAEPCSPRYGSVCPDRGRGRFCGKDHPRLEPLQPGRLLAYEVAERLPAGDLVVVRLKQGEVIMSAADRELYAGLGGVILGTPTRLPATSPVAPSRDAECAPLPSEYVDRLKARNPPPTEPLPTKARSPARASGNFTVVSRSGRRKIYEGLCARCGEPAEALWVDGTCPKCHR